MSISEVDFLEQKETDVEVNDTLQLENSEEEVTAPKQVEESNGTDEIVESQLSAQTAEEVDPDLGTIPQEAPEKIAEVETPNETVNNSLLAVSENEVQQVEEPAGVSDKNTIEEDSSEEKVEDNQALAKDKPDDSARELSIVDSKNVVKVKNHSKRKKERGESQESLDDRFHRIIYQLGISPTYNEPMVIGVASSVRGEGRTTVTMALANAIIQLVPVRVVIVETDLGNPTLAQDLGLQNQGLSELIQGEAELDDIIQPTSQPDLFAVTAGNCQNQPLKTLRNENLTNLIGTLRQQFGVVLLDLPPMSATGEATRAISQTDFVLMLVQAGSTPAKLVKKSLELVPEEKLLGVILNRTKSANGLFGLIARVFRR